jgi:peptidoglycan/LPS O-acetylase OafA/YrhL
METSYAPPKHIPALDGVRGLAVLLVFILHYGGGAQSSNHTIRLIGICIHAGWFGVTLFFLLSGFLISGILWDDRAHPNWWRRFYYRRTLRIFPLYYAALLLVFFCALFLHNAVAFLPHLWIYTLYLQDVPPLMTQAVFLGTPLQLSHFWSLAVEEQFYLLWPFLLIRTRTLARARGLCLTVFALSALYRVAIWMLMPVPGDYSGAFLPARAGELALGAWLAMCFRDPELWPRVQRFAPAIFCTATIGFVSVGVIEHNFGLGSRGMSLLGLPCITLALASLLTLALGKGIVARVFSTAWLRWLGGISYGVYVYHVLLRNVFDWIVATLAPHASRNLALGLRFIVAAALTLLISQISFACFERPILRLRNRSSHKTTSANKASTEMSS